MTYAILKPSRWRTSLEVLGLSAALAFIAVGVNHVVDRLFEEPGAQSTQPVPTAPQYVSTKKREG